MVCHYGRGTTRVSDMMILPEDDRSAGKRLRASSNCRGGARADRGRDAQVS